MGVKRGFLAVVVVLEVLAAACSTPIAQLKTDLGPRAARELSCSEEKLEYRELERMFSTTKVRVSGCKRDITYEMQESQWHITRDDLERRAR